MNFTLLTKFGKKMKLVTTVFTIAIISVLLVAATQLDTDWVSSGQSIVNWRSQPLETKITPHNVNKLDKLFAIPADGDVSATPNISKGVAYFPDWGGSLWAVDAQSGAQKWKVNLGDYTGIPGTVSRTTPTSAGVGTLLVATQQGTYLLAIDQRDGSLQWKLQLDSFPYAIMTSSPSVFQGVAYIGVASIEEAVAANPDYTCCTFLGSVVAVDLSTHSIAWRTYTAPDNGGQPGGYSGNSVWGSSQ